MSRAKGRRPGTRGGTNKVLPEDLPDAAEAALDDLLRANAGIDDDEPATYSRAVSEARILDRRAGDDDEPATVAGRRIDDTAGVTGTRRLPPPVAPLPSATPRSTPVPTSRSGTQPLRGSTVSYGPLPSDSPLPAPTARSTPLPSPNPLSSPAVRSSPLPSRTAAPRNTPSNSGRLSLPLPPIDTGAVPIVRPPPAMADEQVFDTNAVPLIDTGLVPLTDYDMVDLGMGNADVDDDMDDQVMSDAPPDDEELDDVAMGDEEDMSSVLDSLEMTTSRAGGARAVSAPYDDIAFARAASAAQVDDEQLVEDRAIIEVPQLRFAIYEEPSHLGSAQSAVAAAGHAVSVAIASRDAIEHVLDEVHEGEIDAVLVAMPGGEPILEAIATLADRPVVIASYAGTIPDAIQRAIAAGADLATARPYDLDRLAPVLLAAARLQLERRVARAARGARSDAEARSFLALDAFQRMVDLELTRARRYEYPLAVALFSVDVDQASPPPGIRGILRARAGNALVSTLRDIDLATQVEPSGTGPGSVQPGNERFLVLLPYTDLKGAAGVARRVIAAVTALDPVNAAGRSFAPRIVGALAGMRSGEPSSFDKLVKDATRTLEQARRDGAELAVQP
ncbi:MAG: hypothetical protein HOV81_16985 [Kofleriaceae bacterium]|nr:hypothetical protein [Kofleriaceae bacterium]